MMLRSQSAQSKDCTTAHIGMQRNTHMTAFAKSMRRGLKPIQCARYQITTMGTHNMLADKAFKPITLRSSCVGSEAQVRNITTSLAICERVQGVPSSYSTSSSECNGGGMPIRPPGK